MATPRFAWGSRGLGSLLLAVSLGGCGTDVAQTATYMPEHAPAGLDCTPPATPPELPSDPELGGDAKLTTDWLLQAGDYGADQGPGIAIAARDGFRLFVNGRLLAESTDSLSPVFERLTLLPGDNAVSVVVTASAGPPALLALVDELERPYVSDTSWKVSSDPSGDWSAATYDDTDSAWASAQDLGSPEENPGCDPGPGFPPGSGAVWVGGSSTGSAVFRRKISIAPIGFAAGTTGGGAAEPVRVSTTDALVAALKEDAPAVIVLDEGSLDVHRTGDDITKTMACPTPCDEAGMMTKNLLPDDTTCPVAMVPAERSERRISVTSDKTLVGLGRGAQLFGATLDIGSSKNVIVRNVALYGVNPDLIEAGDGVSLDGADGVWVDHVTFESISDGFIDAPKGSQKLTFSWLRNNGQNVFACNGKHPRSNELADTTATIHHTLWQQVTGRAPLARGEGSLVHLFNDVVLDDPSYAVGSACGAQVLLEASSFDNVATPTSKQTCTDTGATPGLISAQGHENQYASNVGRHQANGLPADEPSDALTFSPAYEYASALETAKTARAVVEKRAGTGSRWALPLDYP